MTNWTHAAALAAALWAPLALGADRAFVYSGRIADQSGAPVARAALQVRVFVGSSVTPAVVYPTAAADLPNGLFSVTMAFDQTQYAAVFASGEAVTVEVAATLANGAVVTLPRQTLAAVPFALRVPVDGATIDYDADGKLTVLGGGGGAIVGSVNIVDGAIATADLADGAVTDAKIAGVGAAKVTGTLAPGQLPVATNGALGALRATTGKITLDASGNVTAINADTAATATAATNAVSATNATNATNATTAVSFSGALAGDVTGNQGSTTVNRIQGNPVQSGVPGDGNVLAYSDANDRWEFVSAPSLGDPSYGSSASSPVNAVFVDDSGDVGIGTTNPTVGYKLDVNGSGFFNGSVAVFGVMNSVSTMVNGQSALERTTTNLKVAPAPFYQSLSLFTNGSERVTVDASGNVGIATITPGAALDVKGAVRISGATSGFVGLAVPAAAGATTYTFPSAPAAGKFLKTDGSGGLTWDDPAGAGDMLKATYDAGNNGKVDTADNADQLGGQGGSYYLNAANLTGSLADARLSANVSLLGPSISDSEIVDLDAGKLTGSLADARLSANVSLLGSSISNAEIVDLDAAKLTGTIADARLSANVSLLGASISNAEISDISGGKINAGTVGRAFLETMTGDSGAGGASGAVPAPGAGDAAASKFLKADGTWSTVSVGAINSLAASDGTPAQAVYVDADGAVGIGTASPSAKLHVAGTAGIDGIKFPDGTLQTTAAFAASACAVGFTSLEFNGRRLGCIQNDEANGGAGLNWPDANNFCYDNFGGTLPPMEMLNLSFARLALANEADDMEWSADQEAAAGIRAMTLSGPSTSASATVAPTPFRCWVAGNGAGSGVSGAWSDTGSDIYRNTGNVGIGTTTPEAKLHVGAGHILLDNDHALKGKQVGGSSFDLVRINSDDAVSFYGYQGNLAMNPVNGANYLHASDGGPPRMTLLNGGNVGIGTTDPQAALHVVGATGIRAQQLCDVSGSNCKDISLGWGGSGNVAYGAHGSAGTDRIYVGSTGMVSVNTTSSPFFAQFHVEESNSGGYAASFRNAGGVGAHGLLIYAGHDTTSGSNFAIFRRPDGTTIGTISQNSATTVAYNTTSDRRLKENVAHSSSGLGMLRLINVYDYNYIGEPTSVRRQGYLAQELYEIYPEAVTVGGADASKAPWQVDYGKLTPLLTKSLQEVDAKTENLQTQVDSLESENARLKVMLNELREHICRSSDAPDFCR